MLSLFLSNCPGVTPHSPLHSQVVGSLPAASSLFPGDDHEKAVKGLTGADHTGQLTAFSSAPTRLRRRARRRRGSAWRFVHRHGGIKAAEPAAIYMSPGEEMSA